MVSPVSLMGLGARAMMANYAALQTTGHNIANAGVAGYSRQQVEFATAEGQFNGAGFYGGGVDRQTVTRSHDQFLTREARDTKALSSMDKARYDALMELESVFPVGETGVGHAMGEFLNAMVDVANRPSDIAARQSVLARAEAVASRFNAAGSQLDRIQDGVREQVADTVRVVNGLASSIANLNEQIAKFSGMGHEANDLLDERERLIAQLSEKVQVSTIPSSDGTTSVFVSGGHRLVLGTEASTLEVMDDPENPERTSIAIREVHFLRKLDGIELGGGELAGLLNFQNQDLVSARAQLGQMAAAFGAAVNEQQSFGLDLGNPAGTGAPIFDLGQPEVVANLRNERDGSGSFVAQVSITIDDYAQLAGSEYDLSADPVSGDWRLTRLSDGFVRTVADGDQIDGFTLSLGSPAPAAGDRFLLRPVSDASSALKVVLSDPRGIAAALPVTATTAAANTGSMSVASLQVTSTALDPEQTASISFTSDTGDYNWELRDRVSNAVLSSGSAVWQAGEAIELNGFSLQLAGVPRSGDSLEVAKTAFPASNNGNALAMLGLRDAALVGRTPQADGSPGVGRSFTDAYATALADLGARVRGASVASEVSESVAARAELRRSSVSGVSLDEEAARLLAFQQSYQAAAKVIQAAQTVFDTLLSIGNR